MVSGGPCRSIVRPAWTRIQPSDTQYSSTSWRSRPLKRMPTPRRSVSPSKCGLRGSSERRSGGVSAIRLLSSLRRAHSSAQLADLQPVQSGAVLHRLLGAGQCPGDRPQRHVLAGELVELLDLVLFPGLAVSGEGFRHQVFGAPPLVEGLAAIVFFTSFLGFRASLLPRTCPLAITRLLEGDGRHRAVRGRCRALCGFAAPG